MKNIKSHFVFTKEQRSGIFALLVVIIALQCIYFFYDFSSEYQVSEKEKQELVVFQKKIDSLAQVTKRSTYEIKPYNPNYITDYKGYVLGMSVEEIDRLHEYRKSGKYVNSAKEFQQVTKVSDSLLMKMREKFKFPDWVINKQKQSSTSYYQKDINRAEAKDINKATGLEYKLAYRIINFRKKLGGFLVLNQLEDVYGITEEEVQLVKQKFVLKTIPDIQKINVNLANVSELSSLAYINDYLANNIVDERVLREGFKSLDELKYVSNFPEEQLEHIKLYLTLN